MSSSQGKPAGAVVLAMGMAIFALCAHRQELAMVRWPALFMACIGLAYCVAQDPQTRELMGLPQSNRWLPALVVVSAGVGVLLAVAFRYSRNWSLLPSELTSFALVAMAIGACEEVAYRGIVQGSFRRYGPIRASLIASAFHTAYKCCLFVFPSVSVRPDLLWLGLCTLAAGFLFGMMRERFGGLASPLAAHAAFDLICYGSLATAPWWVW